MTPHAPNRNPCEASFRMVDERITVAQRDAMSNIDLYCGIDSYFVREDGKVDLYCIGDLYYGTIKRNGVLSIEYNLL